MDELLNAIGELRDNIERAVDKLDINAKKAKLSELDAAIARPNFWDNQDQAREISARQAHLKEQIAKWEKLQKDTLDLQELAKTGDHKLSAEIKRQHTQLKQQFEQSEFELKLSGPYDENNAIVSVHAGAGGTDAQDWAQMLERMYLRWAEAHGYQTELISESAGEEAGIKSATMRIEGSLAYGRLQGEHGVHRLVRKSPYNADNLRQTSFALVEVLPELAETESVEINPGDIRTDLFRSSGAGGQSVNKTESAVRLTHLPTGISVAIQNERSQTQNKETAMKILKAKLHQLAQEQQQHQLSELKGKNVKAEWGRQIRNYVLDPYQIVKDLRSGHQQKDVEGVLDGSKLDGFIEAYLADKIGDKDNG